MDQSIKKKGKMKWMMQSVIDLGTKSQRGRGPSELDDGLKNSEYVKNENPQSLITAPATPKENKILMKGS